MCHDSFITSCIIITLPVFVFGTLFVLYVVAPSIIRVIIAKARVDFRSITIEQIQNDRFHLRAQLELSNTGSIPATIVAPLIINVNDVGILTHNESICISGDTDAATVVLIDAPFIVSDFKKFRSFSRSLIFESNVVWNLNAEVTIRPILRHMISYSNIPFHKTVTLNALNGLPQVDIDSIVLARSNSQQIIADITIIITNPSIFTINLGK